MAYVTISATALPNPTEYSVTVSDMDSENTGRTETGVLQRDRIRAHIYKISYKTIVTTANLKTITDAIEPASFSTTFFDPTSSSYPTITAYAGDKSATKQKGTDYWEIGFDIIEF